MGAPKEVDNQKLQRQQRVQARREATALAEQYREVERQRAAAGRPCPVCGTAMSPWLAENGFTEHLNCDPESRRLMAADVRSGRVTGDWWTPERAAATAAVLAEVKRRGNRAKRGVAVKRARAALAGATSSGGGR